MVGQYSGVNTLDPVQGTGSITIGGNEYLAIYGTLMQWDNKSEKAVPYMAEGMSHNTDYTEWTLKLRQGMVFSDGSPYDAAAVVKNLQRDMKSYFSIANSLATVASVQATDATTVSFKMKQPNAGFDYGLSGAPGMIGAPSYLDAVDGGNKTAPAIGAGPFVVSEFKPGVSITLTPNAKYAFDKPLLSKLTFQVAGTEQAQMQAFESGQLQAGVVLDSHSDAEIKAKKIPTFASTHNSGVAILMNNREKSALHDVRLRQAIQLAFNPNVWNERNNAGEQIASDLLFMKGSLFYSEDEQKLPYDPAKAKQLVAQVKADTGWNGTLRWVGPSTQTNQPVILSSMLNPIGVKLDVTNLPVANFFTKVYVEHDFDLAGGGWGVAEAAPFGSLYASYVSPTNQIGYSDPQMTQIVNEMGAAGEPDQQKAVMKKYIARYVETAPVISCGTTTWNFFHKANVHGLAHVAGDMMQFDKAWVS